MVVPCPMDTKLESRCKLLLAQPSGGQPAPVAVAIMRRGRRTCGYCYGIADGARDLMPRPVCMNSNIHSVLFAPDTLDFWVASADAKNVASHTRYTHYNLTALLAGALPAKPDTASGN